jgi:hypothetical protein
LVSRYDLTEFEWRGIAPLLPNKWRGWTTGGCRHEVVPVFRTGC